MPHVQLMHDRYKDRGLLLLAISYEKKDTLRRFLGANSYTMPVGSDPTRTVVGAFGIRGWPSSFLIDKDGKIAFVGGPYGVEPAIEKALGLESSPGSLVDLYLDAIAAKKPGAIREALTRLTERAPADFDLRAWAAGRGGVSAADGAQPKKIVAAKVFDRCIAAARSNNANERSKQLGLLAASGSTSFDLASWSRRAFGRAFPIKVKEFKKLLRAKSHGAVLDALMTRSPSVGILAAASKNTDLKRFCSAKLEATQEFAKKGIMAREWVFSGRPPKDNKAFWQELSVSGMQTSKDRKKITGILLGGATVTAAQADGFVTDRLRRAFLMKTLSKGKKPALGQMAKKVAAREKRITKDLRRRYGTK